MSKLLKNGFSIYKIFLKNKIAMAVMMLVSGVMMFIAALKGNGNDTVAMPLGITLAGAALTFWSFYKVGRIRSEMEALKEAAARENMGLTLFLQISETILYLIVTGLGIFLLINQNFMDKILNLMAGGFTTLNGVLGAINLYKRREQRDLRFWLRTALTVVELVLGPCFIFMSDGIEIGWYVAMGALTTVAGTLEVISALTPEHLKSTVQDGKDIVRIIKEK
ncbi:DUF308 domain-containing protein [Candidatus Saccharibacteria bacterium]|nr:DUF308 domain-containing protein [Candidatus Saccharibacteria bacterium]MBR0424252.1 DUF308 domain-containing protein [Candidatus Saccharibacteria bacterium]